jgi:uncharacterized protein (TIGR04255 family)
MSLARKYRNPPVVEALCEIFFRGSEWDDTVIGQFYDRIQQEFPQKQQVQVQEAEFHFTPTGEATAGFRSSPRIQFRSRGGERIVQLGRDLLVVNQLAPYPRFEDWEPIIYSSLETYRQIAQPKGIARLGLRYINRIGVPGLPLALEELFTIYPRLPSGLGKDHGPFLVRMEVPRPSGHTVLLTFSTAPDGQTGSSYLLDLYDILRYDETGGFEDIPQQVKAAHANLEAAFETSITEKLRALFGPEGET